MMSTGKQTSSNKEERDHDCVLPPINESDVDTMTIHEIKTTLKEMGIATKCRREDNQREILRKAIADNTSENICVN